MGTCGCSPGGTGRSAGRRGGGGHPAAGARPWAGAGGTRGPPECSSLRPEVPAVPAPPQGAAPVIRPGDTDVTPMVSLYPHLHGPTAFLLCPSVPVPPLTLCFVPTPLVPHLHSHALPTMSLCHSSCPSATNPPCAMSPRPQYHDLMSLSSVPIPPPPCISLFHILTPCPSHPCP